MTLHNHLLLASVITHLCADYASACVRTYAQVAFSEEADTPTGPYTVTCCLQA